MLFQIYGDTALWQLLGWALVFTGLVLANEIARRSKAGGIFFFLVLPAALSVYFIVINVAAAKGVDWAVYNDTVVHMNSWFHYAKLYAAPAGCIGFMMPVVGGSPAKMCGCSAAGGISSTAWPVSSTFCV